MIKQYYIMNYGTNDIFGAPSITFESSVQPSNINNVFGEPSITFEQRVQPPEINNILGAPSITFEPSMKFPEDTSPYSNKNVKSFKKQTDEMRKSMHKKNMTYFYDDTMFVAIHMLC